MMFSVLFYRGFYTAQVLTLTLLILIAVLVKLITPYGPQLPLWDYVEVESDEKFKWLSAYWEISSRVHIVYVKKG